MGGNINPAHLSAGNIKRTLMLTYIICAQIASLTGLLLTARVESGEANLGGTNALGFIAACLDAGVSLRGGIWRVEHVARLYGIAGAYGWKRTRSCAVDGDASCGASIHALRWCTYRLGLGLKLSVPVQKVHPAFVQMVRREFASDIPQLFGLGLTGRPPQ